VPCTRVSEIHFEAVAEEGEKIDADLLMPGLDPGIQRRICLLRANVLDRRVEPGDEG
jgi:hypothetical protein